MVDAAGRELGERQEGRLQFKGPSATSGYYRNPQETKKLFVGDWLDSGDYAYLAGGDIYITGRVKDLIIKGGRNIYPYDLEQAVGNIAGVRKGCVAVFGSPDPVSGTERLVVLAETRETAAAARAELQHRINEVAVAVLGMPADEVVLAPPHTVLKTSSGKIRRAASREFYERGGSATRPAPVWWQVTRLTWAALWPQAAARSAGGCGVSLRHLRGGVFSCCSGYRSGSRLRCWGDRPPAAASCIMRRAHSSGWPASRCMCDGLEHLPRTACVLAINHTSYLDGVALFAVLPPEFDCAFAAKRELAGHWLPRLFLRAIGVEFVERFDAKQGVEDVEQFMAALAAGRSPVFFPEGTLEPRAGLQPFRSGAFAVAARAGVPVVPVVIRGARSVLRDETWMPRRGAISITVLPAA